jgi:hypothetical protein
MTGPRSTSKGEEQMRRRDFIYQLGGIPLLPGAAAGSLSPLWSGSNVSPMLGSEADRIKILLPSLASPEPLSEAVLFGFDDRAFPFQNHVETRLTSGTGKLVLSHGDPGSHDEVLLYYGTVLRIGNTFHMWYNGNYGTRPEDVLCSCDELPYCFLCYATSKDGVSWEKPSLGLVDYKGSKRNNICDFSVPNLWSTAAVLHDPDDPDPNRHFKMAYEAKYDDHMRLSVAFSPDGLHWRPSPVNPIKAFFEVAGVTKFRGLYYIYGQGNATAHGRLGVRRLEAYVSDDFEHWSPCMAIGLDRSPNLTGPPTDDAGAAGAQWEEVHLGAGVWNRGNVLLGIYGQWHGNFTGDRQFTVIDLGLALSHDAVHFYEPIPGFRFIPAREQLGGPRGVGPALTQGQGMENFGDQTFYWYGIWRGTEASGVRLLTWPRDRLGMLQPFVPDKPRAISCPVRVLKGPARVFVNASGLGQYSHLRVGLMTDGFRPIAGYSDDDTAVIVGDGLRLPVRWKGGDALPDSSGPVRIDIRYEGVRPEDAALHAVYVAES